MMERPAGGGGEKAFHRNGDGADEAGAQVAHDDANLLGVRQRGDMALQNHSGFAEKFVLLLLEIDFEMLFIACEDIAGNSALNEGHIEGAVLAAARFLEEKLPWVEGDLQLQIASRRRGDNFAVDDHAEAGG